MNPEEKTPHTPIPWYYIQEGNQVGPIEESELRALVQTGKITPSDLVWNSTMGEQWVAASTIAGLFDHAINDRTAPHPLPAGDGMIPNRDLMTLARASLKNRWAFAVSTMLLYMAILMALPFLNGVIHGAATAIISAKAAHTTQMLAVYAHHGVKLPLGFRLASYGIQIVEYIVSGPLVVGMALFFLNLSRNTAPSFQNLFISFQSGWRYFWKTVGVYFLIGLMSFGWMLLFMLPGGALLIWAQHFHDLNDRMMILPAVLLLTAGFFTALIVILRYAMIYFIVADQPNIGIIEAIDKSTQMMHGKKWKYFCLMLRFLGWFLLTLLTCGIGLFWVFPYLITAQAYFYYDVKGGAKMPEISEAEKKPQLS
jgi:uncharacterized membrane protein